MADDLRSKVLAALDVPRFYEELEGLTLSDIGKGQYNTVCPFHEDNAPSLNIRAKDGVFNCFSAACGAKGSVFDFHIRKNDIQGSPGEQFKSALHTLAKFAGIQSSPTTLDEAKIPEWQKALLANAPMLKFLREERGLKDKTIAQFRLGWDGERITIPVFEKDKLVNVRRYLPKAPAKMKMLGITGHNGARLFLPLTGKQVLLTEGELDCIFAFQEGFNANTVTGGAGSWKDEFTPRFRDRSVVLGYDHDDSGRRGAASVGRLLLPVSDSVTLIQWPADFKAKGDVTDYLLEKGKDALAALVAGAVPLVLTDEKQGEFKYPLTDLGNAERLVERFGDNLRYVDSWGKWLTWNGDPVWRVDESRDATNRAIETVRAIAKEAQDLEDEKLILQIKKFAVLCESERKIAAVVVLARAKLAIKAELLNRDPWVLNLPNGVLHLKI